MSLSEYGMFSKLKLDNMNYIQDEQENELKNFRKGEKILQTTLFLFMFHILLLIILLIYAFFLKNSDYIVQCLVDLAILSAFYSWGIVEFSQVNQKATKIGIFLALESIMVIPNIIYFITNCSFKENREHYIIPNDEDNILQSEQKFIFCQDFHLISLQSVQYTYFLIELIFISLTILNLRRFEQSQKMYYK
ncbi:hypothetical protein PPERSA_06205 [Pseudocohnilembus persalinus]|uniref:Transmembrane protein n=1 Tax=Pseudocohnilembus persalinus TaxID=266149 RepID=A0A0V0R0R8_PSEPJ|nr:hypothetical protein PPERSA_06205 [Pseudocohnilembus persalinus]|eukprot:KRX08027.1 hypothetical protein PPERSA_06205 [Pseudocohnilembus persalinus]